MLPGEGHFHPERSFLANEDNRAVEALAPSDGRELPSDYPNANGPGSLRYDDRNVANL